jgi:bacillithiol synthase
MKASSVSIAEYLTFSSLVKDYLENSEDLQPFVDHYPNVHSVLQAAEQRFFSTGHRDVLADALFKQYEGITISPVTRENIESLRQEKTFTITTGHQLCLYTGPAYFIYKILSAIKLCRELNNTHSGVRFVPVYWMATEDHDFAEINHTYAFGRKIEWTSSQKGAVGRFSLEELASTHEQWRAMFERDLEALKLADEIIACYQSENLAVATRKLANLIFAEYGLVIIDGDDHTLKTLFAPVMASELFDQVGERNVAQSNTQLSALNYAIQVNPRPINLFYLDNQVRARLERNGDKWNVIGTEISFDEAEMHRIVNEEPERLSPNVLTRPLYQETILPNVAYVGGPGELAYWIQLRAFFEASKVTFPQLILRDSALLLSEKWIQRGEKLGFDWKDAFLTKQALVTRLIGNVDHTDLSAERAEISRLFDGVVEKTNAIDPTLVGTAKAELQKVVSALESFEKRLIKAVKSKEEIRIQQMEKWLEEVFPQGNFQERHENFFALKTSFQGDVINVLFEAFNPVEKQLHVITS